MFNIIYFFLNIQKLYKLRHPCYNYEMKIVVISDTHSDTSLMNKVLEKENDADLYIHCGDYCVPEYFMNSWRHVMGNCDWDVSVPKVLDIDSPFGLIHVEHGNSFLVQDPDELVNYLKRLNAFIFLYGHTHVKNAIKINNTYVFNPGSLSSPSDSEFGSYLVINIDEKTKELKHTFYKVDLQTGDIEKDTHFKR